MWTMYFVISFDYSLLTGQWGLAIISVCRKARMVGANSIKQKVLRHLTT